MDTTDPHQSRVTRPIKFHHLCYLLPVFFILITIVGICWSGPLLYLSLGKYQRYINGQIEAAGFEIWTDTNPPPANVEWSIDVSLTPYSDETNATLWAEITLATAQFLNQTDIQQDDVIWQTPIPDPAPIWVECVSITWWHTRIVEMPHVTVKLTIWIELS